MYLLNRDGFMFVVMGFTGKKAAGIAPKSRDNQPLGQLYEVEKLQAMVEVSIKGLAARGEGYKQIYRGTNQLLTDYARMSLIPERFQCARLLP